MGPAPSGVHRRSPDRKTPVIMPAEAEVTGFQDERKLLAPSPEAKKRQRNKFSPLAPERTQLDSDGERLLLDV